MKAFKIWMFCLAFFGILSVTTSCRNEARHFEKADSLYKEGSEKRHQKQSEVAAELFSQALLEIEKCDAENENVQQLKGKIEDDLGAMYWKHGLMDDALEMHQKAARLFCEVPDSTNLAVALRNSGRVAALMEKTDEAEHYYDEALQVAKLVRNDSLLYDIQLEQARDFYMNIGDYQKAIENVNQVLEKGIDTIMCHLTLGVAHFYMENDSLAALHLHYATQSEKAGIRVPAYQALYTIAQEQGDIEKALEYHELFSENLIQTDNENHFEQVQRIKADYDLQVQKNELQAEQRLKNVRLYLFISLLLIALLTAFFILRQKMLNDKLKLEQMKNQMELALKKNKVYVTALALSEQVTSSSLAFNLEERDWQDFIELTDFAYGDFTKRLMAQYPTLTDSDLQICCLTKQGFSNHVISILLGIQTASFARRKSYIKQEKMNGLNDNRSFEEIINAV